MESINQTITTKENSNYKKALFSKKRFINLLFILLPFADMLNGYLIRGHGMKGIGTAYHLLLTVGLVFVVLSNTKLRVGFYEKCSAIIIAASILSFLYNGLKGVTITSIGLERESKIICNVLNLMCINCLIRQRVLTVNELYQIIKRQIVLIAVLVLLSDISGLYNAAYTGGIGRMGLYANMNELTIILSTSLFFIFREFYYKVDIINAFLAITIIIDLFFIQSKFALGMIAIAMMFLFILIFSKRIRNGKISLKTIVLFFCGALVLSIFGQSMINRINNTISSSLHRIDYLQRVYGDSNNILDVLSSGRTTRFRGLWINPIKDIWMKNPVEGLFSLLLGNGFTGDMNYTFEMDLFDLALFNGILGAIVYIVINIRIIIRSHRQTLLKDHFYVYIIIIASVLVGHVWTGGVCGIYYAIFSVYAIYDDMREKYKI